VEHRFQFNPIQPTFHSETINLVKAMQKNHRLSLTIDVNSYLRRKGLVYFSKYLFHTG
jgi:hypothetical protein